jgi:putative endonuclease
VVRPLSGDARAVGAAGEALAAEWLGRAGLRVLTKNYRAAGGEVDIIAEDRDELVFVEVRTRRRGGLVGPEESLTRRKQQRLLRAAEHYLWAVNAAERPWRIDLVAIEIGPTGVVHRVEHLRNVVEWG